MQHKILNVERARYRKLIPIKLLGLMSPVALGFGYYNCFKPAFYDDEFFGKCMLGTMVAFFLAFGVIPIVNKLYDWDSTYFKFVKEWPENKPYTPECLQNLFEEFYLIYKVHGKNSPLYQKKFNEVNAIVGQAIYNRFPPPIEIINCGSYSTVQRASVYY